MIQICPMCHKVIENEDLVSLRVKSIYHSIPSERTFAIERDMTTIPDSLRHFNCQYPKGEDGE